jgi:hypothetical protein
MLHSINQYMEPIVLNENAKNFGEALGVSEERAEQLLMRLISITSKGANALQALSVMTPDITLNEGILLIFMCSHHVDPIRNPELPMTRNDVIAAVTALQRAVDSNVEGIVDMGIAIKTMRASNIRTAGDA